MFDNIGGKLKGLASAIVVVGAIAAIADGVVLIAGGAVISGVVSIVTGALVALAGAWMAYGIGEAVERAEETAARLDALERKLASLHTETTRQSRAGATAEERSEDGMRLVDALVAQVKSGELTGSAALYQLDGLLRSGRLTEADYIAGEAKIKALK